MTIESFREMYDAELSEAVSFEAMMARSMSELGEKTSTGRLRDAIKAHAKSPGKESRSLAAILKKHGRDPEEHTDQSMQAMVGEARKMADMVAPGSLRDAAIIASIQRLKHYEVAVYGTLATYAKCLGLEDEKQTLGEILQREKEFDQTLSAIANEVVNPHAVGGRA
jgi:ferritin-like metal-binding protein YciE